jgi:hypothetical protein
MTDDGNPQDERDAIHVKDLLDRIRDSIARWLRALQSRWGGARLTSNLFGVE